jgi:hypothetical protein
MVIESCLENPLNGPLRHSEPSPPNYALERSVMDFVANGGEDIGCLLSADVRAWCPAQRER